MYSDPYMRAHKSSHCWRSNGNVKYKQAELSFILGIYNSVTSSRNLGAEGEKASFFFFFFYPCPDAPAFISPRALK